LFIYSEAREVVRVTDLPNCTAEEGFTTTPRGGRQYGRPHAKANAKAKANDVLSPPVTKVTVPIVVHKPNAKNHHLGFTLIDDDLTSTFSNQTNAPHSNKLFLAISIINERYQANDIYVQIS